VEERMKTVEEIEQIRRGYFLEHKSMRQIAREMSVSRNTVRKALDKVSWGYTLSKLSLPPKTVQRIRVDF
jgi:transposase-like protein